MLKVEYGTNDNKIEVTNNFEKLFIHNKIISIPKNTYFNEYFGDPSPNLVKYLKVTYNNSIYVINEYDTSNSDLNFSLLDFDKVRVYFICQWENSISLLTKLKKNTPNEEGIWKNIIGINNIENADYIVILDDLPYEMLNKGKEAFEDKLSTKDKLIHFQRENSAILNKCNKSWYQKDILPTLKHYYSYENDFFYIFTTPHFLNKTYDQLKSLKYHPKNNNISCIISNKNLDPTYENRIKFITEYSNKYKNSIDIYGRGWTTELKTNYRGSLDSYHQESSSNSSKYDGLISYKYSICLENYPKEKVTSEKITDSLLCWTLPIYSGSTVTNKYYPVNSFYLIDISNNNTFELTKKISETPITNKNIKAMEKARNLILDKYNIWEQIYQIIKDPVKYLDDYCFSRNCVKN